jgi:hypothetical protein
MARPTAGNVADHLQTIRVTVAIEYPAEEFDEAHHSYVRREWCEEFRLPADVRSPRSMSENVPLVQAIGRQLYAALTAQPLSTVRRRAL